MQRRTFIRLVGGGLFVLGAGPLLVGCGATTRADFSEAADKATLNGRLDSTRLEILYLASLAPSGHNAQPWDVIIHSPDHWSIGSAASRWLPAVDPDNRELLLSVGAFLENLVVAARHYGFEVDYRVVAATPRDKVLLELWLHPGASGYGVGRIVARRTVRYGYQQVALSPAVLGSLCEGIEHFEYFPVGSAKARYLSEGTLEANRRQLHRDDALAELADWIRWSNGQARKYRNGLTPASMGIDGIAGWYVRHFYDRKDVMSADFRQTALKQVREQVIQNAGWLVMTSPDESPASLIETGRRFERLFLRVRDHLVVMHPMSQMLEETPWRNEVSRHLGGGTVQFILRVGYTHPYPEPVSLRMPLAAFVSVAGASQ